MRFSMAIPPQLLTKVSPLCDFDFVLAHMLDNTTYRKYYQESKAVKLLDNGFHERGEPLSVPELIDACKLIEPNFVVCPDWLGDAENTYKAFKQMQRLMPAGLKTRLAVVVQGKDASDRVAFFENIRREATMVCFPFKANRAQWFTEIIDRIPPYSPYPPYIHLLGVSSLSELLQWRTICQETGIPHRKISVDTTKPIKFGLAGLAITDDVELRGLGGWPHEEVKGPVTPEMISLINYNVAFMRKSL